jgi:ubiquinone biosynthesis protein
LTRPATHIRRLLGWGRILARHGALRLLEDSPNTPAPVRRLCRIARFGTRQPVVPDYAGAFRAIGPAAIKLGQTLATRPDLVGEEAARNLLALQDKLPPVDFALIRREIETSFERPLESLFSRLTRNRSAPPRSPRCTRPGPPRAQGRGQGAAPGVREAGARYRDL